MERNFYTDPEEARVAKKDAESFFGEEFFIARIPVYYIEDRDKEGKE